MKKIVCELCEGTVFDKVDGRFVCKGCGTSYSVEEAKSMMQEVEGEEPPSETSVGAVPQNNANQQQLDNILVLATTAKEAGNNQEAENYCNKAIELDAMSYKAWFLKGQAIGWSSTLGNNRMEEAAHSFCKAIDFAPEDEKENLKDQAVEELKKLGLACISLRKDNFAKNPERAELAGFQTDRTTLISALTVLLSHGNAVGMPEGYLNEIAKMMTSAAESALLMVKLVWSKAEHPGERDWDTYVGWCSNIETLMQQAIDASDDDDEDDIKRYETLKKIIEQPMDAKSYKQQWNSYMSRYDWVVEYTMADKAKEARRKHMKDCDDKIAKLRRSVQAKKEAEAKKAAEEKQARIDAYWEAHAEEKAALESEKKELVEKRDKLHAELDEVNSTIRDAEREKNEAVPSETEKSKVEDQIRDLNNRRAKLGLFAGKEKKQIGEEIASLEGRIESLKGKIEEEKKEKAAEVEKKLTPAKARKNELDSELAPITKRISAIDAELTKDPEA